MFGGSLFGDTSSALPLKLLVLGSFDMEKTHKN